MLVRPLAERRWIVGIVPFLILIGGCQQLREGVETRQEAVDMEYVVAVQPLLSIPLTVIEEDGGFPSVAVCATASSSSKYTTLIYIWNRSRTPWWGKALGYPDHDWDYEPVIVIDNAEGLAYAYDSGHYRAGITTAGMFKVVYGSHQFQPEESSSALKQSASSFRSLSGAELEAMNRRLKALPRLPFGRGLSLDWACSNPTSVVRTGTFSGPAVIARVPMHINAVGAAGAVIVVVVAVGALGTFPSKAGVAIAILGGILSGIFAGEATYHAGELTGVPLIGRVFALVCIAAASALFWRGPRLQKSLPLLTIALGGLLPSLW